MSLLLYFLEHSTLVRGESWFVYALQKVHYRSEIRLVAHEVAKTIVTARELGYMAQLLSQETGLVATDDIR